MINEINNLEIKINEEIEKKIQQYLDKLFEWNETTNLTSLGKEEFLKKHVIFSLNYYEFVKEFENIFDFGSGNGVPGIPLSFLFPEKKFILIENKKRKIAFLEYISSCLCNNVEVIDSSAYSEPPKEYLSNFCVITKAFNNLSVIRKFFKTKFELLIPTKEIKQQKNLKIIQKFYPKIGEYKNITFYRILID